MAWTTTGNIRGPQGPQGPQGDPGATGLQGPAGEGIAIAGSVPTYGDLPAGLTADDAGNGYLVEADGLLYIWDGAAFPADGAGVEFKGPEGPQGAPGADGADGLSAYELAVQAGFVGSEAAWQASLVGPQGLTGPTGDTGPQGPAGATGAQGPKGDTGATGAKGDTGAQGIQGVKGDTGAQGVQGVRGTNWYTGVGAPGAIAGSAAGDKYLDTATGDVYTLS